MLIALAPRRLAPLVIVALLMPACDQKKPDPAPAVSAERPDRYADGKVLEREREAWMKSWKHVQPLPSCDEEVFKAELKDDAIATCAQAAASRDALRKAEEGNVSEAKRMDAALTLAFDGWAAYLALKDRGIEWIKENTDLDAGPAPAHHHDHEDDHHPAPHPPGSAGPRPTGSAMVEYEHGDDEKKNANPWDDLVRAYLGTGNLGMRRLAAYLRLGPVPTRKAALERVGKFLEKHPRSKIGYAAINDAWFSESNRDIKAKLQAIRDANQPKPKAPPAKKK